MRRRALGPVPLSLAAAALLLLAACGRDGDAGVEEILRRAESLRYAPLPRALAAPGPPGVFLNARVPAIRIETVPGGLEVAAGERALGVSPLDVPASSLTVESGAEGSARFPLRFRREGKDLPVRRFYLRCEAVSLGVGIAFAELPDPLRARDGFLWIELAAD